MSELSFHVEKNLPFECTQTNKISVNNSLNLIITGNEDRQIRFFDENQSKIYFFTQINVLKTW